MKKLKLFKTAAALALLCAAGSPRASAQCGVTTIPTANCSVGDLIATFQLAGITTNTGTICPGNSYSLNTTDIRNLTIGSSYALSVTTGMWQQGLGVWIDLNNNQVFEASEALYLSSSSTTNHNGTISIPAGTTAVSGVRMRVRCRYSSTMTAADACTSFTYGETEDYIVHITNGCPVAINTQPAPATACVGDNTSFSVSATNATAYQWQMSTPQGFANLASNSFYSGTNSATLSITNVASSMNNTQYRCIVSDTNCSKTSSVAMLTVGTPIISSQPANQTACVGYPAGFSTFATGATGYQWQVNTGNGFTNISNDSVYSNATTSALQILTPAAAMNGYQYRCVVSKGNCSGTTNAATLTISNNCVLPPYYNSATGSSSNVFPFGISGMRVQYLYRNSDFANASSGYITALYVRASSIGTNYNLSNLVISVKPTTQTVMTPGAWETGLTEVFNAPVFSGTTLPSKWVKITLATPFYYDATQNFIVEIKNSSVSPGFGTHTTNTGVTGRRKYGTSTIPGTDGTSADFGFDLQTCPVFATQPTAQATCAGGSVSFTASASMSPAYHWQVNTGSGFADITDRIAYSGYNSNTLVVNNTTASMSGYQYRLVAANSSCTENSDAANLIVNSATATANASNALCNGGNNGSIDLTTTGTAPFTYAWSNGDSTEDLSNIGAGSYTVNVTDANGCTASASATVSEPSAMTGSLSVSPVVTVSGQQPYTIYLGYGPQSVSIASTVSGGTPGYTYSWSPTAGVASATSSSTSVSPTVTTNYVLTVTDANGCTLPLPQQISVIDLVAGPNGNLRYVCHGGSTIAVNSNSMNAHLNHGDNLGPCPQPKFGNNEEETEQHEELTATALNIYPNPTTGTFNVAVGHGVDATVTVTDVQGRIIASKKGKELISFSLEGQARGVYMVTIDMGTTTEHRKITLQ